MIAFGAHYNVLLVNEDYGRPSSLILAVKLQSYFDGRDLSPWTVQYHFVAITGPFAIFSDCKTSLFG